MQPAIGIVLDFDNLLLNTTALKADLKVLVHQSFPNITPEMYEACYAEYRVFHHGRTHMQKILATIAECAGCSQAETQMLVYEWLATLPYEQYVFSGAQELLASLDPHQVFIFTKSEDASYQRAKIEACHFPVLPDHIMIPEGKNQEAFDGLFTTLHEQGITHVISGSDEAIELIRGHVSAQTQGISFEGVQHLYGEHQYHDQQEARSLLGNRYHVAENFTSFASIVLAIHKQLEGPMVYSEGMHLGKERL